jgi:hypothetical protein
MFVGNSNVSIMFFSPPLHGLIAAIWNKSKPSSPYTVRTFNLAPLKARDPWALLLIVLSLFSEVFSAGTLWALGFLIMIIQLVSRSALFCATLSKRVTKNEGMVQ